MRDSERSGFSGAPTAERAKVQGAVVEIARKLAEHDPNREVSAREVLDAARKSGIEISAYKHREARTVATLLRLEGQNFRETAYENVFELVRP